MRSFHGSGDFTAHYLRAWSNSQLQAAGIHPDSACTRGNWKSGINPVRIKRYAAERFIPDNWANILLDPNGPRSFYERTRFCSSDGIPLSQIVRDVLLRTDSIPQQFNVVGHDIRSLAGALKELVSSFDTVRQDVATLAKRKLTPPEIGWTPSLFAEQRRKQHRREKRGSSRIRGPQLRHYANERLNYYTSDNISALNGIDWGS
jgi:hypothetical protein